MDKKKFIILSLFVIGFVAIILISSRTYKVDSRYRQPAETETDPFQGKECSDLECVADRFLNCKIASYGNGKITVLIYGLVDGKCYVKVSKDTTKTCYLSQKNLSIPLLNQLLGNDEGLENVVAQECR